MAYIVKSLDFYVCYTSRLCILLSNVYLLHFLWLQVPASINCRLLEHQREGVKFLYGLYKNNHGGILGDDMYVRIFFFFP